MPPAVALGLGLMVAGGLALVFPYRSIDEELARARHLADPLQIAYLRAWLNVRPERGSLRLTLAQQLAEAGELEAARAQLQPLRADKDARLRQQALLLALDIETIELGRLDPNDPQRTQRQRALQDELRRVVQDRLGSPVNEFDIELARRAAALQAHEATRLVYQRLLSGGARLPAAGWEDAARAMLGLGEAGLAAQLYFAARDSASPRSEQRRLFIAALDALQGTGRPALALQAAQRELGALATDTEVLEYLTRLALAANRPDLAQRYAQMLLRLSLLPAAIEQLQAAGRPVPPAWLELLARIAPQIVRAQAIDPSELRRTPGLPYNERLYSLAYEVFVANGNLRDAIAVAQAAVRQMPGDRRWRLRLAQAADWAGDAALALEQWHAIARASNDPKAWAEVQRRAPQVGDSARWLEALRFAQRRRPSDFALVQQLVAAYERMGTPEQAIELLQQIPRTIGPDERRQRLELLAALAERSGHGDLRQQTLTVLTRDYGPRPAYALGLAQLAYLARDYEAAYRALAAAAPNAPAPTADDDVARDFWDAYAEMARATGRAIEAERALRRIIAAPDPSEGDFSALIALLEAERPLEAAALAEQAYGRFGTPYLAMQAMYLWSSQGSAAQVRAFLARLTPEQRARLEREPQFLLQQASFHLRESEPRLALHAARRALALAPDLAEARALVVWALLAAQDAPALRAELLAHPDLPRRTPALAAPYAAAWLALQEPQRALHYLKPAASRRDPLWLAAAADAYEQLGQVETAWQLRRLAWLAPRERGLQDERRRLALAPAYSDGEAAQLRLQRLLRAEPAAASDEGREAALGYAINRSLTEVADAWLQQHYGAHEARPGWAELSVALAQDDRTRIAAVLDGQADWLPVNDRVEAAARVGRGATAQTLAFDGLARLPDSETLHQRLVERTLAPLQAAPAAGFTAGSFRQRPIEETSYEASATTLLGARHWLRATAGAADRRSLDTSVFLEPPDERSVTLTLGPTGEAETRWQLGVQQRDALASFTGLRGDARWQIAPRFALTGAAGLGQPITDNAVLRAGAQRDLLDLALEAHPSLREFAALSATFSRIDAQGGGRVGTSQVLRAEAGHRIRVDYPDLVVRLTYADLRYTAADGVATPLLALVPESERPSVTNALLLPASTTQWALRLNCGESAATSWSRAWRVVCGAALTQDAQSGWGNEWLLGARGSLFGTDQLWLGAAGGTSRGANATPYTEFTLAYRYYF